MSRRRLATISTVQPQWIIEGSQQKTLNKYPQLEKVHTVVLVDEFKRPTAETIVLVLPHFGNESKR